MHESEKWKESRSVVSDSSDPTDCSLPGSSVHGIFQAKVLEWGAIAFSRDQIRWIYKAPTTVLDPGSALYMLASLVLRDVPANTSPHFFF